MDKPYLSALSSAIIASLAIVTSACIDMPLGLFPYRLATNSPGNQYQVALEEKVLRSDNCPFHLFLSIHNHEIPVVENLRLFRRCGLDTAYKTQYPRHKWITENILWLGKNDLPAPEACDTLAINTSVPIKFLMVSAGFQEFIVIEPKANDEMTFQAWSRAPSIYSVWARAWFADGRMILGGNDFLPNNPDQQTGKYTVIVTDGHITVTSKDYKSVR